MQGEIWDDADPEFNNHQYRYTIQQKKVALKGVLLTEAKYGLLPWISGSLGLGFNRAGSFSNTPLICDALPNPNYTTKTHTGFTYSVGAGIQKELNAHLQVGLGYEFSDWGRSQMGRTPEQTINNGLGLGHLYTNGLMFNLTYIA